MENKYTNIVKKILFFFCKRKHTHLRSEIYILDLWKTKREENRKKENINL